MIISGVPSGISDYELLTASFASAASITFTECGFVNAADAGAAPNWGSSGVQQGISANSGSEYGYVNGGVAAQATMPFAIMTTPYSRITNNTAGALTNFHLKGFYFV